MPFNPKLYTQEGRRLLKFRFSRNAPSDQQLKNTPDAFIQSYYNITRGDDLSDDKKLSRRGLPANSIERFGYRVRAFLAEELCAVKSFGFQDVYDLTLLHRAELDKISDALNRKLGLI